MNKADSQFLLYEDEMKQSHLSALILIAQDINKYFFPFP
jgi:hypothetical protein